MAIYDCFQYFNEDHMVDLRLNILDKHVDYFVISESTKTHQGEHKKLQFNINNFQKFKSKIKYIIADYKADKDFEHHTGGESLIEKHQRNSLYQGISNASSDDLIMLSDCDEIPDLTKISQIKSHSKFIAFSQMMFMYKLNFKNLQESNWIGSKITHKKNITDMQSLRDLKFKDYPFWRIDKRHFQIIKGGWHFSFLQTPEDIARKIKSFSHGEFNTNSNVDISNIEKKISKGLDVLNRGFDLKKINIDESYPEYIRNNKKIFNKWIV